MTRPFGDEMMVPPAPPPAAPGLTPWQDAHRQAMTQARALMATRLASGGDNAVIARIILVLVDAVGHEHARCMDDHVDPGIVWNAFAQAFANAIGGVASSFTSVRLSPAALDLLRDVGAAIERRLSGERPDAGGPISVPIQTGHA